MLTVMNAVLYIPTEKYIIFLPWAYFAVAMTIVPVLGLFFALRLGKMCALEQNLEAHIPDRINSQSPFSSQKIEIRCMFSY